MPPPLRLKFVMSAKRVRDLPETPAEIAMVGRSNVGKSSLINALANQRQLAHVSNTPGRTQLLNLFVLPTGATVMDLPGYGFAKVPGQVRADWQQMIEGYLTGRKSLRKICVLVDGEIGPTKLDVQMLDWVRHSQLPHAVVATKLDKVGGSKIGNRKIELAAACQLGLEDVHWISASKGTGVDAFRAWLLKVVDLTQAQPQPTLPEATLP